MGQLTMLLGHAITFESAFGLLTSVRGAALAGEPPGAARALHEAISAYLADYYWPRNVREKDIRAVRDVLSTPLADGGIIATIDDAAIVRTVLHGLTLANHPRHDIIILASALLLVSAEHCTLDKTALVINEYAGWVHEGAYGRQKLVDRLSAFSALLRQAFPTARGFECDGVSAQMTPALHAAYGAVIQAWARVVEDELGRRTVAEIMRAIPLSWQTAMHNYDQHDWVCVAEVAKGLAARSCIDNLATARWVFEALQQMDTNEPRMGTIGKAIGRLSGYISHRRKREACASLVYCALADTVRESVRRTLDRGQPAAGVAPNLTMTSLLASPHLVFLLEAITFIDKEREIARSNLIIAKENSETERGSPLVQIAKAVPEKNLWERISVSILPVTNVLNDTADAMTDGILRIGELEALHACASRQALFKVVGIHGTRQDIEVLLTQLTEMIPKAHTILRQMNEAILDLAPDAPEARLLERIVREWKDLPLIAIDIILGGDGSHKPVCTPVGAELPDVRAAGDPPWNLPPVLQRAVAGTALEALAVNFGGGRTIRMLTWLSAVHGSPLFIELRRDPHTLFLAAAIIAPELADDVVTRTATGGSALSADDNPLGVVSLRRTEGRLGLEVVGPRDDRDPRVGIFISDIIAGTPAAGHPSLAPGLRIVEINGRKLLPKFTQQECYDLFDRVEDGGVINIGLSRHDAVADSFFDAAANTTPLELHLVQLFETWRLLYSKMSTGLMSFRELGVFGPLFFG